MSKWRPTPGSAVYVCPDIHGQLDQLELICSRIFPPRKSDGIKDIVIFLGDYIDRGPKSPEVIDFLIDAKQKYKDQIVLLCGNHELMLLEALKPSINSNNYLFWMKNGGEHTLSQYLDRGNNHLDNVYELIRTRLKDFVPKEHLNFYNSLLPYYETENYIFVHGGCNPNEPLDKQKLEQLVWDRSVFEFVQRNPNNLPWSKTIVTGHNGHDGVTGRTEPFISEKFLMLDCSYAGKLVVLELNSMEGFVAGKNKDKMVKLEIK